MQYKNLNVFLFKIEEKINQWQYFLIANELDIDQKALVTETIALLRVSKNICLTILRDGGPPSTNKWHDQLIKALELLVKVYEAVEDKIGVANLPDLPF